MAIIISSEGVWTKWSKNVTHAGTRNRFYGTSTLPNLKMIFVFANPHSHYTTFLKPYIIHVSHYPKTHFQIFTAPY